MRVPSGDHAGWSASAPVVIGRSPAASATQMSLCAPVSWRKAIRVPSGDHVGNVAFAGSCVSRRVDVPSRFVT